MYLTCACLVYEESEIHCTWKSFGEHLWLTSPKAANISPSRLLGEGFVQCAEWRDCGRPGSWICTAHYTWSEVYDEANSVDCWPGPRWVYSSIQNRYKVPFHPNSSQCTSIIWRYCAWDQFDTHYTKELQWALWSLPDGLNLQSKYSNIQEQPPLRESTHPSSSQPQPQDQPPPYPHDRPPPYSNQLNRLLVTSWHVYSTKNVINFLYKMTGFPVCLQQIQIAYLHLTKSV